jgi:hypothetical protein
MTLADSSLWPNAYQPRVCECGELEVAHKIRANETRGACSTSRGPKATPCGCKQFVEAAASLPREVDR